MVDSYFRVNEGFVEQTVTVTETPSDIYMEASKIVAGCIEGNRPYVLNILRHLIPDIGYEDREEMVEVPSVTTEITTETIPVQISENRCYKEPFNANQFNNYLIEHNIKVKHLAEKVGLGVNCISRYKYGHQKPAYDPRNNNCMCINGQLMLLDLIEHLEVIPGFRLIQSNTDGLIVQVPDTEEAFDMMDDICWEWEQRCSTNKCEILLELDCIHEIYQKDVNNYLWIDIDGGVERIGKYLKEFYNCVFHKDMFYFCEL